MQEHIVLMCHQRLPFKEPRIHLSELKNLEVLSLYGAARFGDAGLEHLKALPQLTNLDLRHTLVTDDGLLHLSGLGNLRRLTLGVDVPHEPVNPAVAKVFPGPPAGWTTTSPITDEGVKRLQQALPDCDISH